MKSPSASPATLVDLEKRFWQSMVDEDTDAAVALLDEPALMVSAHGTIQFDHGQYRHMAEQGKHVVRNFSFDDMQVLFPNEDTAVLTYSVRQAVAERGSEEVVEQRMADSSVWTRKDGSGWRCVMHTETPLDATSR